MKYWLNTLPEWRREFSTRVLVSVEHIWDEKSVKNTGFGSTSCRSANMNDIIGSKLRLNASWKSFLITDARIKAVTFDFNVFPQVRAFWPKALNIIHWLTLPIDMNMLFWKYISKLIGRKTFNKRVSYKHEYLIRSYANKDRKTENLVALELVAKWGSERTIFGIW